MESFLIGASPFSYLPFVIGTNALDLKLNMNTYPFVAAFYFGTINAISSWIGKRYNIEENVRLFFTGLISAFIVSVFITIFKVYNFPTTKRWIQQYFLILIGHLFTFMVTIRILNKFIYS